MAQSRYMDARYEPEFTYCPFSAVIDGELRVWGGKVKRTTTLKVYNPFLEGWRRVPIEGQPPPGLYLGASAHSEHFLYAYGGVKVDGSYSGCLHRLDTEKSTWVQLAAHSADAPMKKRGCGMIVYENSVIIIGGFGVRNGPIQSGSEWLKENGQDSNNAKGWTNEMHKYDLIKRTWSSIACTGTRPPACSNFSLSMIDDHRAVLFGGLQGGHLSSNVYMLDLKTMNWSKIPQRDGDILAPRADHAAVCIDYGSSEPQLLVTGGYDVDHTVLNDLWILDFQSEKWNKVEMSNFQSRCCHCTAAFNVCPGRVEVIIFGGNSLALSKKSTFLAYTNILRLEKNDPQSKWMPTDVADNTKRGTIERITEKMSMLSQVTFKLSRSNQEAERRYEEAEIRIQEMETKVQEVEKGKEEDMRRIEAAERRAQEAERRSQEAERKVQESDRRVQEAEISKEEAERRSQEAERKFQESERNSQESKRKYQEAERRSREDKRRFQEAERRCQEAERRVKEEERKVEVAEASKKEADRKFQEAEGRVKKFEGDMLEAEQRAQDFERSLVQLNSKQKGASEGERNWLVQRREIKMTMENVGGGGWGKVNMAEFRGEQVAAKVLHKDLQFEYYHKIFEREMNMASRVRSPHLVQFIGASMNEEMIILMELMPTSLRQYLASNAPATPSAVFRVSVSLDVAKALNYLHLMKPCPIIHRDISSANVLLEPLPNEKWRAKVTDYGSVNLQNEIKTENPGSPVYSAPETHTPSRQSTKMDIFSYGVLLVEISTSTFPDVDKRAAMIRSIQEKQWVDLIQNCLNQDPLKRPSASHIISLLVTWQE